MMECLWISFLVFITGAFIILFAKQEYKAKLFSVFMITGLGTAMVPVVNSLMNGSSLEVKLPYTLCFQTFALNMDPFSSFMTGFTAVMGILYGLNILLNKQTKSGGNMFLLIIFALLFTICAINVQNGIYFYLAFSLVNLLFLFFINLFSENRKEIMLKSLPVCLSVICVTLIIMTLAILSNSMQYADMVKNFISSQNCCYFIFTLGIIGFALPVLLSDKIINSDSLNGSKYSESLFLWFLFYSLYFYCFLRFIGMGAIPSPAFRWIFIIFLAIYSVFYAYKLIRIKDIEKTSVNMKKIQTAFSVSALLIGVNGYISGDFSILIFGYLAALLFLVNTVICSYALQMNFKNEIPDSAANPSETHSVPQNNRISKTVALIAAGNYAGIPMTLGFWAWLSFFCALIFGCFSPEIYVKQLCVFAILFSVFVFFAQLYKVYFIFKNYVSGVSDKFPVFNLVISAVIILSGIFFTKVFKLFVVPVSFFSGGTRFYNVFESLSSSVNILCNCIFVLALLALVLAILRFLILRNSESNSEKK